MPPFHPDSIPVSNAAPQLFANLGVDVEAVFASAGVPYALLTQPDATITTRMFFSLWYALERHAPRDISLRFIDAWRPHHGHLASLAGLHAPNYRAALQLVSRYKRFMCPEELSFGIRQSELRIQVRWTFADGPLPALLVEIALGSMLRLAQRGTGVAVRARRLELARVHRSGDEALLADYFGASIVCDAPVDTLVLDAAVLDMPFITRDADVLASLAPRLAAVAETRGGTLSFSEELCAVMHRRWTGQRPSVRDLARALGVSSRSLQRRLGECGTSYQAVLDQARREAARRMLANTALQANQIAFLLGFKEPNSFYRAFQTWEQKTPIQWRAEARVQSDAL